MPQQGSKVSGASPLLALSEQASRSALGRGPLRTNSGRQAQPPTIALAIVAESERESAGGGSSYSSSLASMSARPAPRSQSRGS